MSVIRTLWPVGSYSSRAAKKLNKNLKFELEYRDTIKDVIASTLEGCYGIIPLYNAYGGVVQDSYEWLSENKDSLMTMAFVKIQIEHCLAGVKGTVQEDVKTVYSHPQALKQCQTYLESIGAAGVPTDSTTAKIQTLKPGEWLICDRMAAEIWNLEIIEDCVSPDDNYTVFALISNLESAKKFPVGNLA